MVRQVWRENHTCRLSVFFFFSLQFVNFGCFDWPSLKYWIQWFFQVPNSLIASCNYNITVSGNIKRLHVFQHDTQLILISYYYCATFVKFVHIMSSTSSCICQVRNTYVKYKFVHMSIVKYIYVKCACLFFGGLSPAMRIFITFPAAVIVMGGHRVL